MKPKDIRELSDDELYAKRDDIRSELMNLRFQKAKRVLENPARISTLKRDAARINTVMVERKLSR